eukprot:scaffold127448_cov18-Tisochrysis_lutea.AAC.2
MKEAVEQFCAITGTNSTEAENILEAVNGNVERAVDLYYAGPSARSTDGDCEGIMFECTCVPRDHGYLLLV